MRPNWPNFYRATRDMPPWPRLVRAVSVLAKKGDALDLGCGAGRDTRYLLEQGFSVTAVDREAAALEALADSDPGDGRLQRVQSSFEAFSFAPEAYDLINAHFALPFIEKAQFADVFTRLKQALRSEGVFVGQFFGIHDTWNTPESSMTFLTLAQVREYLADLKIWELTEEENDGTTALGDPKHWHVFHCVVQKA